MQTIDSKFSIEKEITHLFRYEYGKLVSVLTKTFGASNIQLAEDVVQDAMLEALKQWTYKGVPENPVGWIYSVAKFKAINIINKEKTREKYSSEIADLLTSEWTARPALDYIFSEKEIEDDLLRMMFTCCHPSISVDSQIALTLKTLCGFSIPEIATAFITSEENINKRLVRARKTIRETDIPFEVPSGNLLDKRLENVLETIYLLFNEGYNASSGDDLIRYELCKEAIRLTEIIATNPITSKNSSVFALLSLMLLNSSRFKTRVDSSDQLVDLEHQDRSKWYQEMITRGLKYLEFATQKKEVSKYHILAAISAHHCTAKDFESTDWEGILSLYNNLLNFNDSPIIKLNRAVVVSKIEGPKKALEEINRIKEEAELKSYLHYYIVCSDLYATDQKWGDAIQSLHKALEFSMPDKLKNILSGKLKAYTEKI